MYYKEQEIKEPTVFVVYKNADMTEGSGPMVVDSIWGNKEEATKYMNKQFGVMGRPSTYNNPKTGHAGQGWQDKESWPYGGDWEIKEVKLYTSEEDKIRDDMGEIREQALQKLTNKEKYALGIK